MKKVLVKILLSLSIGLAALSTSNAHAAGLESINLVPKMTSNTAPSGEAFASSSIGGQAYMLLIKLILVMIMIGQPLLNFQPMLDMTLRRTR